jgi:hypothetical protein
LADDLSEEERLVRVTEQPARNAPARPAEQDGGGGVRCDGRAREWLVDQGTLVRAHDPAVKTLPPDLAERITLYVSCVRVEFVRSSLPNLLSTVGTHAVLRLLVSGHVQTMFSRLAPCQPGASPASSLDPLGTP